MLRRYLSQLGTEGEQDEKVTPEHLEQAKIDIIKEMNKIQKASKKQIEHWQQIFEESVSIPEWILTKFPLFAKLSRCFYFERLLGARF